MPIKRLSINHLRNIDQIEFVASPSLNLFYGENGAGKTSILEAINLLSLGRSFRHRSPKPLISYHQKELVVFAEVGDRESHTRRLGVQKNAAGENLIHIDGKTAKSAAQLAEVLPILNLNSQSFELLQGPPKPRRQLLDWLTFHVEPSFLGVWKELQNCLKQRNSLLRSDKIRPLELDSWDRQLTDLTEKIDSFRSNAFECFAEALAQLGALLPDVGEVTLRYKKGWPLDQEFKDVLAQQRAHDALRGFTQAGPHRADLAIKADGQAAADALSRGQSKIVIAAMIIALARAFTNRTNSACTLLVDDLPSELDERHRQRVGSWLKELGAQLFVTAVDKAPLTEMWPQDFTESAKLFHVKQGRIEIV